MLSRIADGRTDLVFEYIAAGNSASSKGKDGVPLIQWCSYYGDVSSIRFLLSNGESIRSLGDDMGLNAAVFHGHWQLTQFLVEQGADVNRPLPDTGETPLHAALCRPNRPVVEFIVKILLSHGADPNRVTKASTETGAFMRDSRTKAETPLHRAAAFGSATCIQLLLDAGAKIDAKDMNGDSPLSWASWHLRPDDILRKLCYGAFSIHPDRCSASDHGMGWSAMDSHLLGKPHTT
jgi:ankyrin repeat protein